MCNKTSTSSGSPSGDVYVVLLNAGIIRPPEDKAKPAAPLIPGSISVSRGTARIAYTLSGIACPELVGATATVAGWGISCKADYPDEVLEGL